MNIEPHRNRVGHHYDLAVTHRESGSDREAVTEFESALQEADQLYAGISYELGLLLKRRGGHDKALDAFERSLARVPNEATFLYEAGVALNRLGRFEEAVEKLEAALEQDPEQAEVHREVGYALRHRGWYSEALHALDRAMELDPEDALARHDAALVLDELDRQEEAIARLEEALVLRDGKGVTPSEGSWRDELGALYEKADRLQEAVEQYQRAVRIDSTHPGYNHHLALAHRRLGE
jgi:tetratricopeptide (TPR) repeat protein